MAIEIEKTIAQLTLAEKIEVLAGGGACSTIAVPRLGIPKLQVSFKSIYLRSENIKL